MPIVRRVALIGVCLMAGLASAARAQLVVLTPTGEVRDNLPVVLPHPDATATEAVLTRGYSGRLLRLYALVQEFLHRQDGRKVEPAYLVLSNRQGGFPQSGFYLDAERKPDAGWVDLHRSSTPSGRFGAMDQIFPHELLHVIARQLAGTPRESGGNQMHAVGVRTDPVNAFHEGFAEHAQILAVDDADATEDTRALRADVAVRTRADREVAAYARDLARAWWPVQPARLRFLVWFSQAEQVQRYHAVKANLFARTPDIPSGLLARDDKYAAYLFNSVMPGRPDAPAKPAGVMLSTDGVVAHLFWRIATDEALRQRYLADDFYRAFGTARAQVAPLENVYLKIFFVLHDARPSTSAELLRAWARIIPEDAADLERVARDALLEQPPPDASELWLANEAFLTGTSLFDQYRALPRVHTFDANAATAFDWITVPGITPELAARLVAGAPYPRIDVLVTSAALPEPVRARIASMADAMTRLRQRAVREEESLSLWTIARSYLWRIGAIVLASALAGAWLARRAGARRWWTAGGMALASSLIIVALAWVVVSPPWYPAVASVVIGGMPWAIWRLLQGRGVAPAAQALLVWAAASAPALVLTARW